jgi:hypothetical protein
MNQIKKDMLQDDAGQAIPEEKLADEIQLRLLMKIFKRKFDLYTDNANPDYDKMEEVSREMRKYLNMDI